MLDRDRAILQSEQATFVKALLSRGDIPDGFDRDKIEEAQIVLRRKRRKSVYKSWPLLVNALGADFEPLFQTYARKLSTAKYHHGLVDGRLFARFLERQDLFPYQARDELRHFDLVYRFNGKRLIRTNHLQKFLYRLSQFCR